MAEAAHKSTGAPKASQGRARAEARADREAPSGVSALGALQGLVGNRAVSSALGVGRPLPPNLREEMESRFDADFGKVRIHDDARANASAAGLHAKAYTHGHDIVFNANRFAPHSGPGKRLLAHELAHVVQQRRGGAAPVLDAHASHEQSADIAADAVAGGQGHVTVAGSTGVGVARDEDEGWSAKLRRKYREIKEKIPPEYREKMQKAADFAADKAVDAVALPFGPAAAYATDGLGSSLLHGAQKAVSGEEGAADDIKKFGRDKVQEGLGAAKGVATQVTEVVDTAMWVGNEYKEFRDKAARKIGGEEGSVGNTMVKQAFDATARVVPGMQSLPELGAASDEAKKHGLVDPDTGQASITAPMSGKLNEWAKGAEKKLGAAPRDPEMFTPMEKAEIASSIGTQVALSATGAEEVKLAMNAIGALSGLRSIVETVRHDKDWKTSPRFWGHVIGLGLSLVGLKHAMAANKITTLVLKYGGVAAAIPVLAQLAADYYKLETNPQLPEEERKKLEASIKQGWIAVIHIVKEAILHVAQSQGGKPKGAGGAPEEGPPGATPAGKGTPAAEEGAGPKPAAKVLPAEEAASKAPPAAKPAVDTSAPPVVAAAPIAKPAPTSAASTPPVAAPARPDAPTPIASAKGKPQSTASKTLEANLAKQAPEKAGTVTRLPTRKAGATPPSEPASQQKPAVVDVPEPIAVGQTHGAGTATAGKPKLGVIQGGSEPARASLKPPGANVAPAVVPTTPGASKSTAPRGGTAKGAASAGAGKPKTKAASQPTAKASADADQLPPVNAKGGRGSNDEPLVAVRVAGGGGKTKGTYYEEGTPKFDKAATDPRFTVVPKSTAEGVFGARPAGTAPKTDIQPMVRNGVQVESGGAGGGKANQHKIMARAGVHDDPDVNAATFGKTIGAARTEAQGYTGLLESGEHGIQRPGNATTGGVDAITARVPADGTPATVYLNDFTTPGTSKGPKSTHKNWVNELGDAIQDKRFGFGNAETDRAVLTAIKDGNVHVRPVSVEFGEKGPTVNPKANTQPVDVPPAIRDASAKALAKLPPPSAGPAKKTGKLPR